MECPVNAINVLPAITWINPLRAAAHDAGCYGWGNTDVVTDLEAGSRLRRRCAVAAGECRCVWRTAGAGERGRGSPERKRDIGDLYSGLRRRARAPQHVCL